METWKEIKDYEGLYEISSLGNVRSLDRKVLSKRKYGDKMVYLKSKPIKTIVDSLGYCRISLCKNGTVKAHKIHKLVCESFKIGNGQINHIDGNKKNNKVDNLEFCTSKENNYHAFITNLRPDKYRKTIVCNENNEVYKGVMDCAKKLNISHTMVSSHLRGNCKNIKGYTFKYL
jgi:hypothetical protein